MKAAIFGNTALPPQFGDFRKPESTADLLVVGGGGGAVAGDEFGEPAPEIVLRTLRSANAGLKGPGAKPLSFYS